MNRKGEDRGRGIPQTVSKFQSCQRPEALSHQGSSAKQSGSRRGHKGHPQRGSPLKNHRSGQHRRQQQVDSHLRQQHQWRGRGGADPLRRPGLGPQGA